MSSELPQLTSNLDKFWLRLLLAAPMVYGLASGYMIGTVGFKEAAGCLIGIIVGIATRYKFPLVTLGFITLIIVAVWALFQHPYRGTHRWLEFGNLRFNIVLPLVSCTMLFLTQITSAMKRRLASAVTVALLLLQPSISTATIYLGSQLFGGMRKGALNHFLVIVTGVVVVLAPVMNSDNRISRLGAFIHGKSYQVLQIQKTLRAIQLCSRARREYQLPAATTDLALLHLGRRMGAAAAALHLLCFAPLCLHTMRCLRHSHSVQGLCISIFIVLCVFVNVCICLSLLPPVGVPAPFLGKGASSWFCFASLFAFVIVQSPNSQKPYEKPT